MERGPLVSIKCLVYNHEPFLRQCLDGIVMQKTDFPFEAIVHDDASTDGSAAIIREYAEQYPDIIKPIYETENQYSKKDGSLSRIMNAAIHPDSKYIALCEGDDYWTDPQKLQIQVNFLEAHQEYTMCFHRAITIKHGTIDRADPTDAYLGIENKDYESTELLKDWIVPTASMVYNRKIHSYELNFIKNHKPCYGDIVIVLECAEIGRVRGINRTMSAYRIHPDSILHNPRYSRKIWISLPGHYLFLKDNFKKINVDLINRLIAMSLWGRSKYQENAFKKYFDIIKAFTFDQKGTAQRLYSQFLLCNNHFSKSVLKLRLKIKSKKIRENQN